MPPPIPRLPFERPDFGGLEQSTGTLVLTDRGNIESVKGQTQLPYLLGSLATMPFEPLPAGDEQEWVEERDLTITTRKSDRRFGMRFGPRFGPYAQNNSERRTGGGEKSEFAIDDSADARVTVKKKYSLSSPAPSEEDPGYEMDGSGTWVFDRETQMPAAIDYQIDFTSSSDNATITTPLTVVWERITEDEYAAIVKEREERLAELMRQAEERRAQEEAERKAKEGKPLEEEEKREILADLNSSQWPTVSNRLRKLKGFKPHPDDFDVALRVKELRSHNVIGVSMNAKRLWDSLEPILDGADSESMTTSGSTRSGSSPFRKQNNNPLRTWTDNTGTFSVEAKFVRVEDGEVVLIQENGEELEVTLDRLSDEDQTYVDEVEKPKPENPFRKRG